MSIAQGTGPGVRNAQGVGLRSAHCTWCKVQKCISHMVQGSGVRTAQGSRLGVHIAQGAGPRRSYCTGHRLRGVYGTMFRLRNAYNTGCSAQECILQGPAWGNTGHSTIKSSFPNIPSRQPPSPCTGGVTPAGLVDFSVLYGHGEFCVNCSNRHCH